MERKIHSQQLIYTLTNCQDQTFVFTYLPVVFYEHFSPYNLNNSQTVHLRNSAESLYNLDPFQQLCDKTKQSLQFLSILVSMKHYKTTPPTKAGYTLEDSNLVISSAFEFIQSQQHLWINCTIILFHTGQQQAICKYQVIQNSVVVFPINFSQ